MRAEAGGGDVLEGQDQLREMARANPVRHCAEGFPQMGRMTPGANNFGRLGFP